MEAFRDLLQRGSRLLGEVLTFTRNAEIALGAFEKEKLRLDEQRQALARDRERLAVEAAGTTERAASMARELDGLQASLQGLRAERMAERHSLEMRLEEALSRGRALDQEVSTLRRQSAVAPAPGPRRAEIDGLEDRLAALERELDQTRATLRDERARRDRAISLIKPLHPAGEPQTQGAS